MHFNVALEAANIIKAHKPSKTLGKSKEYKKRKKLHAEKGIDAPFNPLKITLFSPIFNL